ncbi:ecto-NOX disulfide-thiol exchanger 2-like [Mytilus edulis]|uniref:ecto-NOX disulfide-thiol exchanger 2-like n=1 Tax=Mytilus edulis TaxID=6550 RepID=UPI0039F1059C
MIGPQKPGRNRGFDPNSNNAPLQFDGSKGKPPMPLEGNSGGMPNQGGMNMMDRNQGQMGGMNMMGGNQGPQGGMNMMGGNQGPPGGMNMMGGNQGPPGGMNMMGGNQGPPGGMNMMGGNQGPQGGMNMMGGMGFGGQMGYGGGGMMQGQMMGDANMQMMYNQYSGYGPMGQNGPGTDGSQGMGPGSFTANSTIPGLDLAMLAQFMPKEILRLKSSVCYPPPMNAPPPSVRERPPGCRTIFVGGIPENSTEDMLAEVFENFGIICSIRKGKKNFAHIRFEHDESADRALFMSGYRMKIEDKDDKDNTGRLHVDYANARDDQYEFECKERAMARQMRHMQRMEDARLRPPSPPPIVHYNDHEAMMLMDKLKSEENFVTAVHILNTWLERGDCSKRNVSQFYTLIQCANARIRNLQSEKQTGEEEIERVKMRYKQLLETILQQYELIERVFAATQKQRNWDHFTKAQRKNIELWYKQIKETRQSQMDEFFSDRKEDDMEMSDNEDEPSSAKKKKKAGTTVDEMVANANQEHINFLKSENDSLKCQLDAYKNEVEMIKHEQKAVTDTTTKDNQIKMLQQALQGMQQQLIQAKQESKTIEKENEKLKLVVIAAKKEVKEMKKSKKEENEEEKTDESKEDKDGTETDTEKEENEKDEAEAGKVEEVLLVSDGSVSSSGLNITEKEAKLIGLVACFLHVHPMGASVEYIWSYINQLGISTKTSHLEDLLEKLPFLFRMQTTGVGALIERKWQFSGYKDLNVFGFL